MILVNSTELTGRHLPCLPYMLEEIFSAMLLFTQLHVKKCVKAYSAY